MKAQKRRALIHHFSGVGAIFFPVGKLDEGGTCEFATDTCLCQCAAFKNATENNKIPYEKKEAAYKFITTKKYNDVVVEILKELHAINSRILYWNASGDCPDANTKRVSHLVEILSECGIVQMGFTRNFDLWNNVRELSNVHMVLTVESFNDVPDDWKDIGEENIFAYPDYKTGETVLFLYDWEYREPRYEYRCGTLSTGGQPTRCKGHGSYVFKEIETHSRCDICYEKKLGCFKPKGKKKTTYYPR